MTEREREAAAQRKRRERDRHRRGMRLADRVEHPDQVTEMLMAFGLLPEARSEDPKAVAAAISHYLQIEAQRLRSRH